MESERKVGGGSKGEEEEMARNLKEKREAKVERVGRGGTKRRRGVWIGGR